MNIRAAAVIILFLAIISSAYAEPRYAVTELGPVDGATTYAPARAINNHRQIVCCTGFRTPLYLWNRGTYTSLGINSPQDIATARFADINDAGQVTGAAGLDRPCVWQNGTVIDLGAPDRNRGAACGINNHGQVVGWYNNRAFLWENGTMTDITPADWLKTNTRAYAINDSGMIVGRTGSTTAIWNNGQSTTLDSVDSMFSEAFGVNNDGVVVGWTQQSQQVAYMFQDDIMTYLGSFERTQCRTNAINNNRQMVGYSYDNVPTRPGYPPIYIKFAALWEDGILYNLNDLVPSDTKINLFEAWDINDRGDIVGEGVVSGKSIRAFLLTPWLVQIDIDICPGVEPNEINLNSKQIVQVAVLSTEDFNTAEIDYASVRFAGAKLYRHQFVDLNHDGMRDVILWFHANDFNLYLDSNSAELSGRNTQGRPFHGSDDVVVCGGTEMPVPMKPRFTYEGLPSLPNTNSSVAYGINNLGQVVGDCGYKPCIWNSGKVKLLSIPGITHGSTRDINDAGQVVGVGDFNGSISWIYQNGCSSLINIPDCTEIRAIAMNNHGAVVGITRYLGDNYGFVWQNGEGTVLEPHPGNSEYSAQDINDAGTIAGYQTILNGQRHVANYPCTWTNGIATNLPLAEAATSGDASVINNRGDIVGRCWFPYACAYYAVIWRNNIPSMLKQTAWGSEDFAEAMNDWGQIVGSSSNRRGAYSRLTTTFWHSGIPYDLNEVTTGIPQGYTITSAIGINNNSQITGSASSNAPASQAFILNPVPTEVTIDIRPDDPANVVNTRSKGTLPVVLYSNPDFTTSSAIPETLTLAGAKPQDWKFIPDINGDGRMEVMLKFKSSDLKLSPGAAQALLTARTFDGWYIEGRDKIKLQPDK